jgi:hypothetical protein
MKAGFMYGHTIIKAFSLVNESLTRYNLLKSQFFLSPSADKYKKVRSIVFLPLILPLTTLTEEGNKGKVL